MVSRLEATSECQRLISTVLPLGAAVAEPAVLVPALVVPVPAMGVAWSPPSSPPPPQAGRATNRPNAATMTQALPMVTRQMDIAGPPFELARLFRLLDSGALALDEFASQELSCVRLGQLPHELDLSDPLVGRNCLFDELHDIPGGRTLAGPGDPEGPGDLARKNVALGDDGGLHDRGGLPQDRFQLGRGDRIALVVDGVLLPVQHVDVAVLVEAADVARAQPAIGSDGLGGRLRLLPVTLHHLGSPDEHFANLADGQLFTRFR